MKKPDSFLPPPTEVIFTKQDPMDLRLGNYLQNTPINSDLLTLYLAGYPDDEGVTLNKGRAGSALAPNEIRKFFYKMTPPAQARDNFEFNIIDDGNLNTAEASLDEKHSAAFNKAKEFWSKSTSSMHKRVSLGSGHDYGYSDCKAFVEHYLTQGQRPVVINLDAHLDVRSFNESHHSGTPFSRLLAEFSRQIDFYEIGIQPQCNARAHFHWAKDHSARIIMLDEIQNQPLSKFIQEKKSPVFLSLDMDALQSSEAPGVSAPVNFGLTQFQVRDLIFDLQANFDFRAMGIYEVNPQFDVDGKTARLAAQFIYDFFFNWRSL